MDSWPWGVCMFLSGREDGEDGKEEEEEEEEKEEEEEEFLLCLPPLMVATIV